MKTIYLVRHAKSSWEQPGLPDIQRPLLEKGKKKTRFVIDFLKRSHIRPDLIISSHAVRARETAKLLAMGMDYPQDEIMISQNIYYDSADQFYHLFYDLNEDVTSVMIVGHNPAITAFVNLISDREIEMMPTSAIAAVRLDISDWTLIGGARGKLIFYETPGSLSNKFVP
ncbi:MAG: phosphohistidine phosphatase SixA [Bacteroidales bacterium]